MQALRRQPRLRRRPLSFKFVERSAFVLVVAIGLAAKSPAPIIDRRPPPMIPERSDAARTMDQQSTGVVPQVGSVDLNPAPASSEVVKSNVNAKSVLQKANALSTSGDGSQVLKAVEQRIEDERSEPARKMGIAAMVIGFVMLTLYGLRRWIDAVVPNPGPTPRKLRW